MSVLVWFLLVFAPIFILLGLYIHFRFVVSTYWKKRNVPHLKPIFLFGNLWRSNILESISDVLKGIHLRNRKLKLVGFWLFHRPAVMVTDLELTKRILIRDFNHFRDRGIEIDSELDPLIAHLFILGGVKWRNLRVKLTPTFTSGKMRFMFPTLVECGHQLQKYLREPAEIGETIEMKDVLACFTTDVISSCAFGLQTNSLVNPDCEFRQFGRKIFKAGIRDIIVNILFTLSPRLIKALRIHLVPKDVSDFFVNAVHDTIEYREKNNVTRNDFLQLLIQLMRAGKVEDADRNVVDSTGLTDEELVQKFELNEAAAQCFVFFAAGFETSSTAMTFALYELALNPDIQTKLQDEIDEVLNRYENELTYDAMSEMEYLDLVVQETLRKYPPLGNLQRSCNTDYHIPEFNTTIEKGTLVFFSVHGFHEDPEVYPKPEVFDPERFRPEMKNSRHAMSYLPFGEGPRNCIGNRFGLMQVKVGLISVLREFTVEVCENTPIPVRYDVRSFTLAPSNGMPLTVKTRK